MIVDEIVARFDNDTDSAINALRTLIGVNQMWADTLPTAVNSPYIQVMHSATSLASMTTKSRNLDAIIQFGVFSEDRGFADSVLEAIELAYLPHKLTLSGYDHLGTYFNNRSNTVQPGPIWLGLLELRYNVSKYL